MTLSEIPWWGWVIVVCTWPLWVPFVLVGLASTAVVLFCVLKVVALPFDLAYTWLLSLGAKK